MLIFLFHIRMWLFPPRSNEDPLWPVEKEHSLKEGSGASARLEGKECIA